MENSVKIHMKSVMTDEDGQQERYDLHVIGRVHVKGEFTYIQYEERMEDTSSVHNLFKVGTDELIVIRKGSVSMRQQLIVGKKTDGIYQTPYGRLPFEVEADNWHLQWNDESQKGELTINYKMTIEGNGARLHNVTMKMTKVRE